MFRKILLLILLTVGFSGSPQKIDPDYDCFDIEIDLDLYRQRDDNNIPIKDAYVVCRDQKVTIPPLLEVEYLRRTDQYEVQSIQYDPFPVTGGTDIVGWMDPLPWQDSSSCVVDLPFKFCFYDKTYEKIIVWSNGVVTFYDGDDDCPTGTSAHYYSYLPLDGIPGLPEAYFPAIMGTHQHTHWNFNEFPDGRIFYAEYGEAPCRKFVITFYNMPPYGLDAWKCPPPQPMQHHQIVLHETWNVVDVNVIQHNACPGFEPDNASAIIGIAGSPDDYLTPFGRDYGPWDAGQESWRFAPKGEFLFDIEWYVDDVLEAVIDGNSEDLSLDLTVDKMKEVRADLVVETCDIGFDQRYVESYKFTIRPAIEIDQLDLQPIICDKDQNSYDLNSITQMVKAAQTASEAELDKLRFLYYSTEGDARDKLNQITNIRQFGVEEGENPVFVRIESEIEECFEILESNIVKAPVEVIEKVEVFLCDEYTLPVLTNDEFYYKVERLDEFARYVVKTIPDVYENLVIDEAGYYQVYVKKANEYGCENVKSFLLMVESCKYPKGISPNYDGDNDYLDLTYNNVQELKIYNRHGKLVYEAGNEYKREWAGQDMNNKLLPAGTYFLYVKTKNYEYQDWIQLIYEAK